MKIRALMASVMLALFVSPAAARQSVSREFGIEFDRNDPFAGHWGGGASIPSRFGSATLDITRGLQGQIEGLITLAPFSIFGTRVGNPTIEDGVLRFHLPPPPPSTDCIAEFRLNENSQRLEGSIRFEPPAIDRPDARVVLVRRPRMSDLTDVRSWSGVLDQEGSPLPMTLRIGRTADGRSIGQFDIPEHNYYGADLSNLEFDEDLGVMLASIPEVVAGVLDLEIRDDGRRLVGAYTRGSTTSDAEFTADPFIALPLEFANSGGGHSFGELTVPSGPGPHPCVVILGTFGPNDRDGISAITGSHRPYKRLAEALTRRGYAVFRFDDRGLGLSRDAGVALTIGDLAADASQAIARVASVKLIDASRIVLLGHGEGGFIAPMLASKDPKPAAMVLLNAPAGSGVDLVADQAMAQMSARHTPPSRTNSRVAFINKLLSAMARGESDASLRAMIRENVVANRQSGRVPPALLEQLPPIDEAVEEEMKSLGGPWIRSAVTWDTGISLSKLKMPVLALYAGLDTQVPAGTAAERARAALASGTSESLVETLPGLNHYMQAADKGLPEEYPGITEPPFSDEVIARIADWLDANLPKGGAP